MVELLREAQVAERLDREALIHEGSTSLSPAPATASTWPG